ncbi:HAD-IA family hydrolase [Gammaproteobacteria bacterium AS21]|jgi:putative hydrolase of the HAD superfamily
MIKCLTFDLDDTLWDIRPVLKNTDTKMYQWLTINAPRLTDKYPPDYFTRLKQQVVDIYPKIAHSVTDIRLKGLELSLLKVGYAQQEALDIAQQAFQVALAARQEVTFFEHVQSSLQRLKSQGYLMGAITNGNADIYRVGLGEYFDFQFNAHDAGVEKPNPIIYQLMLEHTELKAEQIIHIGDNPIADVQGAQELGMSTIWVNVIPQVWSHPFQADQQVDCLSELPKAVENIIASRLAR